MRKFFKALFLLAALLILPASGLCSTRALLVACREFVTMPSLSHSVSGNLHMIGSAFLRSGLGTVSIEDGTIGTPQALRDSILDTFATAGEDDLSIVYLCTHGIISSADDNQVYLLLGDGQTESPLSAAMLYDYLKDVPGEKLLIVDACFSGALIGRGIPGQCAVLGQQMTEVPSPFLADPSIHVLTSADGSESSWYYDSEHLSSGAVSYFASALASGLGLYGTPEADTNSDGLISLSEITQHLRIAVPSSTSQLLSACPENIDLPVTQGAALSRPLSGFSYGSSLLFSDDPTLDFSFTVSKESAVQYRVVDYDAGRWNWENALTFLDEGEEENQLLTPGRKTRSLTLSNIDPSESGYVMLQIFSVSGDEVTLCSERLLAVQPKDSTAQLSLVTSRTLMPGGQHEAVIDVLLDVPAEMTVCVYNAEGELVKRLASSQLTRPSPEQVMHLYWDGCDEDGKPVPCGEYTVTAETRVGNQRQKAAANITVGTM